MASGPLSAMIDFQLGADIGVGVGLAALAIGTYLFVTSSPSAPSEKKAFRSDPIVPVASFERASYSATTQVVIAACGGHLGFVAARGLDPDLRWLDWRIVDWVAATPIRLNHSASTSGNASSSTNLRATKSEQLGAFGNH